ncbi:hypothetical protein FHS85_005152 [Rhodoligotrophos appendicifer]|nr:hypothetical protein [Rhodoligotrophos appendicifer]
MDALLKVMALEAGAWVVVAIMVLMVVAPGGLYRPTAPLEPKGRVCH